MKKILTFAIPFIFPVLLFAQGNDLTIYPAPTDPGYTTSDLTPQNSIDATNQLNNGSTVDPYATGTGSTTPSPTANLDTSSFKSFVSSVTRLISNTLVPLLITIGVVMFIWSLAMFVIKSNDQKEREKAKQYMIWSIIGLALVFSILGIAFIVRNSLFGSGTGNFLPLFREQ